jgi:FGGY-family pentulose kinase
MDHRAAQYAEQINGGSHPVLRYVGGRISPEMETPKLCWLKHHMPESWRRAAYFFDLPDYLTWRATGDATRSLCSAVCKWTYLGHERNGWDATYFRSIELGDLVDEQYARIGQRVRPLGEPIARGLTEKAAKELALRPGTAVSVSIIDAHAGGIGTIGAAIDGERPTTADLNRRLALIGGTSSCHMAVSPEPRFIDGVWGPYFSAMVPGLWLTEGGQSATGSLVDMMVFEFAGSTQFQQLTRASGQSAYQLLNDQLASLAGSGRVGELTEQLHVCPYFHGNRSPRANPALRGMISGLRLGGDLEQQASVYLATIQAIAMGTRHIVDAMNGQGYAIDTIIACGGGTKNPLFLQQHADVTGCRIVLPREPEAVLLGAAMLGAVAAGEYASVTQAMGTMSAAGQIVVPDVALRDFHARKYRVFHQMYEDQLRYKRLMDGM